MTSTSREEETPSSSDAEEIPSTSIRKSIKTKKTSRSDRSQGNIRNTQGSSRQSDEKSKKQTINKSKGRRNKCKAENEEERESENAEERSERKKSKRAPRGIFGLPSKNMLFSFIPRAGDEWPDDDDSDDSDFEPSISSKVMAQNSESHDEELQQSSGEDVPSNRKLNQTRTEKPSSSSKAGGKVKRKSSRVRHKDEAKKQRTGSKRTKNNGGLQEKDDGSGSLDSALSLTKRNAVSVDRLSTGSRTLEGDDDSWGQRLPLVALEKILHFAVLREGVVPLLCRVSKVCHLWREAARSPSLWTHVNLDNGRVKATDATLEWLTANRFSQLLSINLNSWTKLTDRGFIKLIETCPNLESISVQRCAKLSSRSLYAVKDHCRHLKHIDIGFTGNSLASSQSIRALLENTGETLEELNVAGCTIMSSVSLMNSIKVCCPNLRVLDMSNCQVTVDCLLIPVEDMQATCPHLEVLRLAGTRVQAANATAKAKQLAPGFERLLELSIAVADNSAWQVVLPQNLGVSDDFLERVLRKSHNLKLLDLRGCAHITVKILEKLPVESLEHLYISRCSLSKYEGVETVVSKWRHSLIELDLSWNIYPAMSLDVAMKKLSSSSQLRTLDLSGTNISTDRVRSILKGCPKLECLKLTSCRGLPRGTKHWYEGESLKELRRELLPDDEDEGNIINNHAL